MWSEEISGNYTAAIYVYYNTVWRRIIVGDNVRL